MALVMHRKAEGAGHRDRLRRRYIEAGIRGLADHEILELLLTYAIPRRDVKSLARRLLAECGDVAGVLGAPNEVLLGIDGIGPEALGLIRLICELPVEMCSPKRRQRREAIASVSDAVKLLDGLVLGKREEEVHQLLLNAKNAVVGHEVIVRGDPDHAPVRPRDILEPAIARKASGFLLAHNHPSGDPAPSEADRRLTRQVARTAALMDVRFVDHIILGDGEEYSFRSSEPELFQ